MQHSKVLRALVVLLAAYAAVSVAWGFHVAIGPENSQDFQYSGARVLAQGNNPYDYYVTNPDAFLLAQKPNYFPFLYFLLIPLGTLDWPSARLCWAICNVAFAGYVSFLIYRAQLPSGRMLAALLALVFLSSTEVRVAIGNGQQALLVTLTAILTLLLAQRHRLSGLLLAVSLTKYSVGAFLLAGLVGDRTRSVVFWALTITLGSFLALWLATHTSPSLAALLAPVTTATTMGAMGFPFDWIRTHLSYTTVVALCALGLLFTAASSRRLLGPSAVDYPEHAATVAVLGALTFAPHGSYDYVVLAVPFALGLTPANLSHFAVALFSFLAAYHWAGYKVLSLVLPHLAPSISDFALTAIDGFAWAVTAILFGLAATGFALNSRPMQRMD